MPSRAFSAKSHLSGLPDQAYTDPPGLLDFARFPLYLARLDSSLTSINCENQFDSAPPRSGEAKDSHACYSLHRGQEKAPPPANRDLTVKPLPEPRGWDCQM
jgi:hypothetical protein